MTHALQAFLQLQWLGIQHSVNAQCNVSVRLSGTELELLVVLLSHHGLSRTKHPNMSAGTRTDIHGLNVRLSEMVCVAWSKDLQPRRRPL